MLFKKRLRRLLITLIAIITLMTLWGLLPQTNNKSCTLRAAVGYIFPTKPGELWRFNTCEDDMCVQYLAPLERRDYNSCTVRSAAAFSLQPSSCRFMNGSGRKPVALASFPGSGNTWVRGLLQLTTGICTGSLYCDKSLRRGGFPGEGVRSGSVLVVKTHKWKSRNRRVYSNFTEHFSAAIFIIRNPFHALVSERHRMASLRHTDVIGAESFGVNASWSKFVKGHSNYWEKMVNFWVGTLTRRGIPLLVVQFEQLREDTVTELGRMSEFLGLNLEDDELRRRLGGGFDQFKRKHRHKEDTQLFTDDQIAVVRRHIQRARRNLADISYDHTLPLDDYIEYSNHLTLS